MKSFTVAAILFVSALAQGQGANKDDRIDSPGNSGNRGGPFSE